MASHLGISARGARRAALLLMLLSHLLRMYLLVLVWIPLAARSDCGGERALRSD